MKTITIVQDQIPDFWDVFGAPFEAARGKPHGWDTAEGVLTVHIVEWEDRAGDQDVEVRLPGGRLAYFDAGPEYRWMVAPKGIDVPGWVSRVEGAAARANQDHTDAILETIADEVRAGTFPVLRPLDDDRVFWGAYAQTLSRRLTGEPDVVDGVIGIEPQGGDSPGVAIIVVVRLADGRLGAWDDEESSWVASEQPMTDAEVDAWVRTMTAKARA